MNFGPNLVHLGPVVLSEENAFQQISDSKTYSVINCIRVLSREQHLSTFKQLGQGEMPNDVSTIIATFRITSTSQ